MSIPDALQHIRTAFDQQIQTVQSATDVEALRVTFLGRKGKVADCFQLMRDSAKT